MKVYIARGQNAWTASLDRDDAIIRLVAQTRTFENIQLVSTTGDWSVSSMDGCVESTEDIVQESFALGDAQEMASYGVGRLETVLAALEEVTDENYRFERRELTRVEEHLDEVEDWSAPKWGKVLIGNNPSESSTEG
jgi:hypothetical protein